VQACSWTLESQQAALLELLRGALGVPVSFADLNAAGIEFPASVVSELELAGVEIERRVLHADGTREMGVRLDPSRDLDNAFSSDQRRAGSSAGPVRRCAAGFPARLLAWPLSTSAARTSRALGDTPDKRWLAPVALFATVGLVTVLALIVLPAGSMAPRPRAQIRPAKSVGPAVAQVDTRSRAAGRPEATLVSAALAVQLQASGHELLEAGRYAAAIEALKRAVTATGEQLDECLEPVSATCLTYAYALYDLGHALQLSGHPSAAVGVLQRRLQIDNQRPTVQNELTLARTQAGLEPRADSAL